MLMHPALEIWTDIKQPEPQEDVANLLTWLVFLCFKGFRTLHTVDFKNYTELYLRKVHFIFIYNFTQ